MLNQQFFCKLWNLRKKGELKGFNVGGKVLFTDEEIKDYVERQRQKEQHYDD